MRISSGKSSRHVVTGASSMLGIALVKECLRNRAEVIALARPGSENTASIPRCGQVKIVSCDLKDIQRLPRMIGGRCDVFFHLGWAGTDKKGRNDPWLQSANIDHTLRAVKAAKELGCKVFLGAGSQAEYGKASGVISTSTPAAPEFAYAAAKYAAGRLSAMLCEKLGIKHVWARVFSVYGPNNRKDNMIMYCIGKLLKRQKPALTKGKQLWDYLYCSDAARALYLAALKGRDQGVYNVGSGQARPLKEYVNIIRNMIDSRLKIGFGEVEYAPGQIMRFCADISNLTRDTGFVPTVPFARGIKETINWRKEGGR